MTPIKFGTDGWRAIIAKDYTIANLKRVAQATSEWVFETSSDPSVVIGYDCRFEGKMFGETVAQLMGTKGIKVYLSNSFVSTPMVSLATVKLKATAGIIITASHNPAAYNGFKIKAYFGGPALPSMINEVENKIPDQFIGDLTSLDELKHKGLLKYVDLESMYCKQIQKKIDIDAIHKSKLILAYDAMYGAGQNVIRRLLPDTTLLHCVHNPGFNGIPPEPIHKNLQELSSFIRRNKKIASGLATDGDADRIGMYDNSGNFIDSHHLILLLIHYLHKYKKLSGKVITTFSCTHKIKKLCEMYKLPHLTTRIGFKYICEYMSKKEENILLGGEESGGIAISNHIPERDGIWIGLIIWEYMAKTRKSLSELIHEIYDLVGKFAIERDDLHIDNELKKQIIVSCENKEYNRFGDYIVKKTEDMDGYKFYFNEQEWVLIRPSGTEPVLRIYAESLNAKKANDILKNTRRTLLKNVVEFA